MCEIGRISIRIQYNRTSRNSLRYDKKKLINRRQVPGRYIDTDTVLIFSESNRAALYVRSRPGRQSGRPIFRLAAGRCADFTHGTVPHPPATAIYSAVDVHRRRRSSSSSSSYPTAMDGCSVTRSGSSVEDCYTLGDRRCHLRPGKGKEWRWNGN